MKQKSIRIVIASALLASTSAALALPFNSFDPRSMAMGGAGVAVGDSSTAPFFNPALLTITHEDDLFSLDLPIIGARIYDPDDFETSVDDFQNGGFVDDLQAKIDTYNAVKIAGTIPQISTALTAVTNDTSALSTEFAKLSDKPIQGELGAGIVIGIPSKSFGSALYATGWGAMGGEIKYRDDQTLQDFVTASNTVNTTVSACAVIDVACLTPLASDPLVPTYFTVNLSVPSSPTVDFNTNTNLASSVNIRGVVLSEVGVALSTEFGAGSSAWGFGITPKVVRATLLDYTADVNSGDTGNATDSDYTAKYTSVNFDLGLAKDYANGWRTGFVVKNVLPRSFDFKSIAPGALPGSAQLTTGTLNLKAQARVGVSHSNDWSTVALDVDLTNNDPAGFEDPSKYVALGAELDAWGWAQLRLGYRADVKNSDRNVASVGVGISPFGVVHIDLAASGNADEVGGSARLAFTF